VYCIAGCKNSSDEFDRMANSYHLRLERESDALNYFEFYLAIDPPHYRLQPPRSELELKQLAERKFSDHYSDFATADAHFNEWWKSTASVLAHCTFGPVVSKTATGYTVKFLTVSDVDPKHETKGVGLLEATVDVRFDGQVTTPRFDAVRLE
jgi:hypothetical protein